MSGKWACGRARQAVTHGLGSVCWRCRIQLQRRSFNTSGRSQSDIHSMVSERKKLQLSMNIKKPPQVLKIWRLSVRPKDISFAFRAAADYFNPDPMRYYYMHTDREFAGFSTDDTRTKSQLEPVTQTELEGPEKLVTFSCAAKSSEEPEKSAAKSSEELGNNMRAIFEKALLLAKENIDQHLEDNKGNLHITASQAGKSPEDLKSANGNMNQKEYVTTALDEAQASVKQKPDSDGKITVGPRKAVVNIEETIDQVAEQSSSHSASEFRSQRVHTNSEYRRRSSQFEPRLYSENFGRFTNSNIQPTFRTIVRSFTSSQGRCYATTSATLTMQENNASAIQDSGVWGSDVVASNIREGLRAWQERQPKSDFMQPRSFDEVELRPGSLQNLLTRSHGEKQVDEPALVDGGASDRYTMSCDEDRILERTEDEPFLQPGDLVELSCNGHPVLAVFIRQFKSQAQFYTMDGDWVHRRVTHVYFAVQGFLDVTEIAPLQEYLPNEELPPAELNKMHVMRFEVPRTVGSTVVAKLNLFLKASNEAYRDYADRIDHAYDLMAEKQQLRFTPLIEIASNILQIPDHSKISKPQLWAVHRVLMQSDLGFTIDPKNMWRDGKYEILSKRESGLVRQVREWLREYQEQLILDTRSDTAHPWQKSAVPKETGLRVVGDFIKRARQVIKNSREYRQFTVFGGIGPSSIQMKPERSHKSADEVSGVKNVILGPFTEEESVLLRFIELWACRRCFQISSPVNAMGSMLLRLTGMYDDVTLGTSTGFTFLQEMGVVVPWENRIAFNTRLALPGLHFDIGSDKMRAEATESLIAWKPIDSMRHLRKDWEDLEVFCIDSASAMEIDDGFSLEHIAGVDSQFWIHIHIANPTAFLPPDHPMAKYAAQLTETLYFPETVYPMLSPKVTQQRFSLGRDRPALTFSAKVNEHGEILETRITPSVVRNVKYFTPEMITKELATVATEFPSRSTLIIGYNPPPDALRDPGRKLEPTLTESQRQTLRKLQALGEKRRRLRRDNGAVNVNTSNAEASVHYIEPGQPYRRKIRRVDGDPTIVISADVFDPTSEGMAKEALSHEGVVSDMMILCCETAAIWTTQRGIPVLFRGSRSGSGRMSPLEYKKSILDPLVGEYGVPSYLNMVEHMSLCGGAYSATKPIYHQMIGTNAYTKVTSPLRRYGDMLAHWQIEAALRHEAETGKSLVGSSDHSYLPFSRDDLETVRPHITSRERLVNNAKRDSNRHWIYQALFRAHYFKEGQLPDTFQVFLSSPGLFDPDAFQGITKEFRIETIISENKETRQLGGMQVGDWWEAKLENVDVYMRFATMTPLRLIERTEGVAKGAIEAMG